jgi:[acyl-carrier-protein] S-malonyltransferase
MAGHSFGEYSALVCAGALEFAAAVPLARQRGLLMTAAVSEGEGAMAAILGLEDEEAIDVCSRAAESEVVSAVNFNGPGQVVIAGHTSAVGRAMALAKAAGAKRAVPLAVSVPAHCSLMKPAADELARQLMEIQIKPPEVPVLHNADVATHSDPVDIADALVRQLYSPVRWVETIRKMSAQDAKVVLEIGPGRVLTGLAKRIDRTLTGISVQDPTSLETALDVCEEAL